MKKLISLIVTMSLILGAVSASDISAKGGSRGGGSRSSSSAKSSSRSSSKPTSRSSSSKPSSSSNSYNSSDSRTSNFSRTERTPIPKYTPEYNKLYQSGLTNNLGRSGFFSGNTATNALLWYTLFNQVSGPIHTTQDKKDLVDQINQSGIPVYMLEIKTNSGETKYISVTKEQYDKVKEGDNISVKNGKFEVKT